MTGIMVSAIMVRMAHGLRDAVQQRSDRDRRCQRGVEAFLGRPIMSDYDKMSASAGECNIKQATFFFQFCSRI